ncbi:hypothetical protein HUA74_25325 [Myxococcus sp. CA051A]|uniref:hypothetical protein n=1 Tax=unclassified Myxococcus TaxID=2648731 RepID=UPI00157AC3BF|nr:MULTISPECIES: hypothetical protein [unclassified Myxococcus]NTX37099.1 hypothetical protein [Myxococcus sp. CA033]NTX54759.1 hypothetical protein [Myxococcus sp. CA039A]NTX63981.1 hypothetical protein [Myxococcus sp. CA051A]
MTTVEDLPHCHIILKAALQAARPEDRPDGPWALGGPRPVCPAAGQVELGLWFSSLVAPHLADRFEEAVARRVLDHVRDFLAKPSRLTPQESLSLGHQKQLTSHAGRAYHRLIADSRSEPKESEALAVARRTAGAAAALCRGKDTYVHLTAAVARVVKYLREAETRGDLSVHDFIVELDARILRLECQAAITPLLAADTPPPELDAVLWRFDGGKGQARHFIARLRGGTLGLVTKLGARWAWVEGRRDEVLASVPDTLFEDATRTVMARE